MSIWLSLLIWMSAGCSPKETPAPTQTPSPTPTLTPTRITRLSTPTPAFLGSRENPVGMGNLADEQNADISNATAVLADRLSQETGLSIQSVLYSSYSELLDGFQNGEIQFAWLPPITYITAHNRGLADVSLVTDHFGVYSYSFQILASVDSQFTSYFDLNTNQSPVDAATALAQLQEKTPCWVDFQSSSGYVAPLGVFNQVGIPIQEGVFLRSHTGVIRALYAGEICDFGATYSTLSDPRTDAELLAEFPDLMDKIVIVWRSEDAIPNLAVGFSPAIDPDLRIAISNALQKMSAAEDDLQTLSTANGYEISGFKSVDDSFYDILRGWIDSSGIKLKDLIGS